MYTSTHLIITHAECVQTVAARTLVGGLKKLVAISILRRASTSYEHVRALHACLIGFALRVTALDAAAAARVWTKPGTAYRWIPSSTLDAAAALRVREEAGAATARVPAWLVGGRHAGNCSLSGITIVDALDGLELGVYNAHLDLAFVKYD